MAFTKMYTVDESISSRIWKSYILDFMPGTNPEILKKEDALCRPQWLGDEENFRFQMF